MGKRVFEIFKSLYEIRVQVRGWKAGYVFMSELAKGRVKSWILVLDMDGFIKAAFLVVVRIVHLMFWMAKSLAKSTIGIM